MGDKWIYRLDKTAIGTVVGVILLFATSIAAILFAPQYVDRSWTSASSAYQVQMYEVADPNLYISTTTSFGDALQYVYHLKKGYSLLAFQESEAVKIEAPPELEEYVTRAGDEELKLTSRLLFLRAKGGQIFELYDPQLQEGFALAETDGISEKWVDEDFTIVDPEIQHPYHAHPGVLYVANPQEYRVTKVRSGRGEKWIYSPSGERIDGLAQLKGADLGFLSREELIRLGEHQFAIEGCWYCHTDQSRTLVQDCVLNGTESYPAPPSSANEYIYQNVTFPGTRRIGPDLARVGVKRPSRDWNASHFWSPKTASPGSIMPPFRHFFDADPSGSPKNPYGVPNWRFEAVFQYLMTKGSRITAPSEAWWLGKDPVRTIDILDGVYEER